MNTDESLKKRGRKPKGGKIIHQDALATKETECKPNVILHLKCFLKEIGSIYEQNEIKSFNFQKNELSYEPLDTIDVKTSPATEDTVVDIKQKEIYRKLKTLEHNLHTNNISDKKSACFWCSYDFANSPIYIPKFYSKDSYHVYGCFCMPECAVAYLMKENIDSSTKFERYQLLNHIYSPIFKYEKNIKPAPNPHYLLEKYYGNFTIQEYRELFKHDTLMVMVDKPLTRIFPEFHEDNDDFIINNKIIPSNSFQPKRPANKTNIMSSFQQVSNA